MIEIVEITKKYGVTGVLISWLWLTNSRVEKLETKLENCYELRINHSSLNNGIKLQFAEAILPKKIKIEKK